MGETIESIKNAGSETEALQIATELFGKKGAAEMTQAIREGRLSVDDLAGSLEDYGNVVEDTFNATLDPPDQAKVALNNLKVAGAELGNTLMSSLAPVLERVVEKVKTFTTWFKNLNDKQQETIIKVAAVVAAIGPALIIFGKVATGISKIISVATKIGPVIKAAKAAFTAFHAVLAANPIILIVTAITGLIAILVTLYNKCDWFREAVDKIFSAIKTAFFAAFDAIKEFFTVTLPGAIGAAVEFFAGLWDSIVEIFIGVGQWFSDRFNEAYTAVTGIFSGIGQWFSDRWTDIKTALSTVATWFLTMFQNAYTNVKNVFAAIGQWFGARWTDIKTALATVATWFLTMFQNAYTNVKNVFAAIGQWFSARWTDIKNVFSAVGTWFQTKFNEAYTNIKNVFSNIGTFFSGIWSSIKGVFTNVGTNIGNAIGGAFKTAINSAIATVENAINGAIGLINGAIDVINKLPGVSVGHVGTVSLPRLAKGGILKNGQAIMAEAGPELIQMVNGEAIVTPLTRSAKNTALDAATGQQARSFVQNVNITSPKELSPYETARQTRNATRQIVLQIQGGV